MEKATKKVLAKPSVEDLVKRMDAADKKFDKLLKVCERHFGVDLDRDGKIGEVE